MIIADTDDDTDEMDTSKNSFYAALEKRQKKMTNDNEAFYNDGPVINESKGTNPLMTAKQKYLDEDIYANEFDEDINQSKKEKQSKGFKSHFRNVKHHQEGKSEESD